MVKPEMGESQNGGNKKAKHAKCFFSGKFGVLCFLVTSVLRFAFLPYYRLLKYHQFHYYHKAVWVKQFYINLEKNWACNYASHGGYISL